MVTQVQAHPCHVQGVARPSIGMDVYGSVLFTLQGLAQGTMCTQGHTCVCHEVMMTDDAPVFNLLDWICLLSSLHKLFICYSQGQFQTTHPTPGKYIWATSRLPKKLKLAPSLSPRNAMASYNILGNISTIASRISMVWKPKLVSVLTWLDQFWQILMGRKAKLVFGLLN